jgi:hypothetical protein
MSSFDLFKFFVLRLQMLICFYVLFGNIISINLLISWLRTILNSIFHVLILFFCKISMELIMKLMVGLNCFLLINIVSFLRWLLFWDWDGSFSVWMRSTVSWLRSFFLGILLFLTLLIILIVYDIIFHLVKLFTVLLLDFLNDLLAVLIFT